jgi:hypothetical protein
MELCKWAANAWPTANETAEAAKIDKTFFLNIDRPVIDMSEALQLVLVNQVTLSFAAS